MSVQSRVIDIVIRWSPGSTCVVISAKQDSFSQLAQHKFSASGRSSAQAQHGRQNNFHRLICGDFLFALISIMLIIHLIGFESTDERAITLWVERATPCKIEM